MHRLDILLARPETDVCRRFSLHALEKRVPSLPAELKRINLRHFAEMAAVDASPARVVEGAEETLANSSA
jgi:hypothetical protein